MLTNTCKIAIKAVIYLASQQDSEQKTGIQALADAIQASEHTLGKLLQTLVKQGVIQSSKGPSGGFFMTPQQVNQPIANVVEAIDGKQLFTQCGLGLSQCSHTHPCPLHNEYKQARDLLEKMFRSNTVADLCLPLKAGLSHLIG